MINQKNQYDEKRSRLWHRTRINGRRALPKGLWLIPVLFLVAGCGFSTQIPSSSPSGLSQLLILSSLERATAKLHLNRYHGKRVYVDFFSQAPNDGFIRKYLITLLKRDGADVVKKPKQADLTLRTFAAVEGIDHAERFFGIPAITPPVVGVTTPEIALYKELRDRGYTDLRIYAFNDRTGRFLADESPRAIGKSKYTRYTVLIFLKFTITDVTKPVNQVRKSSEFREHALNTG